MNAATRKLTTERQRQAKNLARAIVQTHHRYVMGWMAKPTYRNHMAHLWAKVEDAGLQQQVLERVQR